MTRPFALLMLMLAPIGAAHAQSVIALSPVEREAALEAAALRDDFLPINGLTDGRIHGEMGVMVGSNGSHAVYGSTIIPLGTTGTIALAFSNENYGRRRRR